MKAIKYMTLGLLVAAGLSSCSGDFLDSDDYSVLTPEEAGVVADKNADAFLNGIWTTMVDAADHDQFGYMATLLAFEVMGEDIAFGNSSWFIYDYDLDYRLEQWIRPFQHWSLFYTNIARANEIISYFPNGPETVEQKGLVGQAYALRGMAYTYLIQIFQDYMMNDGSGTINRDAPGVPIIYIEQDGKSADEIIAFTARNTVGQVLDAAEADLKQAVTLLEAGYERPAGENGKDYIDAGVANGLLARLYLMERKWADAAAAAKKARTGYEQRTPDQLTDGFLDVLAPDVMWGFNHTEETSTVYASFFSHMSNDAPGYAGLDYAAKLIDADLYSQIPSNDARLSLFNSASGDSKAQYSGGKRPYAARKFGDDGNWTQDYIYMRAAEMVLIEAEAEARQGNVAQAGVVLKELLDNRIKGGWDNSVFDTYTQNQAVNYILTQRRIELWGEGFSFFDLKRNEFGINRNYAAGDKRAFGSGNRGANTNHLSGHLLEVPAHDVLWTYQLPLRELQENEQIDEKDQNP